MKKIAGIAIGLFVGWVVLKSCMADPAGSAQKVNDAAGTAGDAGNSASTFISSLSGAALLILVIIGVAIYLGRKK
jgi:ABC-type antimicrobial peptide transport system permease subunit